MITLLKIAVYTFVGITAFSLAAGIAALILGMV